MAERLNSGRKRFAFGKLEVWQDARPLVAGENYGSLMEVVSGLLTARDHRLATEETVEPLLIAAYDVGVRNHNPRQSQLRRSPPRA